ncbi:DNA-binding MarR family transcriptional regulator [Deinobacterium chartae]|uniref:DNA-binding MarR family transcriptional regulator n=1 Tax=Deinobacterium chartae TaxID=521158 RepID=A0A841HUF7_9DEIO|nr:MarR family winged helix-turn-helix transcriptional regulator [Deinobacterium chartae]MBB6096987.1 DNA-binding MarR family transcriptional regulator [Deinobacterium chartae]
MPARTRLADDIDAFLAALWRLNYSLSKQITPLLEAEHNLDLRLLLILRAVRYGVVHPSGLADALQLPASLVSRYLEALARRGLIERCADPHDSRRVRIHLTADGERVTTNASHTLLTTLGLRLAALPPEERAAFLRALVHLSEVPLEG